MFKSGDKVIFIGDDNYIIGELEKYEHVLNYGKEYEIYFCDNENGDCIVSESNTPAYTINSFISLEKYYRKQKLEKINIIE